MASFLAWTSQVVLALLGLFLMIVILLQRGRGGGLAGAFGGMGGQSAFGTKAGDVFTKITIVIAIIWVVVAGGSGFLLRAAADKSEFPKSQQTTGATTDADPAVPEKKPAAGDVPPRPEPPAGAGGQAPDSTTAAPSESSAAPSTTGETSAAPATTEPAATTAPATEPAVPATTEPATPAPTDGAAVPEQK